MVPKKVQYEVLGKFVDKCRDLHALAFFQWRLKFASECKKEECNEMIDGRLLQMQKDLNTIVK